MAAMICPRPSPSSSAASSSTDFASPARCAVNASVFAFSRSGSTALLSASIFAFSAWIDSVTLSYWNGLIW